MPHTSGRTSRNFPNMIVQCSHDGQPKEELQSVHPTLQGRMGMFSSSSVVGDTLPTEEEFTWSATRLDFAQRRPQAAGVCGVRDGARHHMVGKPGGLDEQHAAARRPCGRRCWRAHCAPAQPTLSRNSAEHRLRRRQRKQYFPDSACDGASGAMASVGTERKSSWSTGRCASE